MTSWASQLDHATKIAYVSYYENILTTYFIFYLTQECHTQILNF